MYNLLITSTLGAWDKGYYEYDKSRLLEYTNDEIVNKIRNNLQLLKKLPCLFAYEQFDSPCYLGRITEISEHGRNIFIEYEKITSINSQTIELNSMLFDIRDWESNRTHWAVKDVNLLKALNKINCISEIDIKNYSSIFQENVSLTPSNVSEKYIMSLNAFIKRVFEISKSDDCTIFYRGHSKKNEYKLAPSLFRTDEKGNYKYLNNEDLIFREMLITNPGEFAGFSSTLDILIKMQHYSLPTRLLDITSNPLIALYFACKSNITSEGEVIIFKVKSNEIKYFDSDTVSCISNLARLPKIDQDSIDFKRNDFNNQLQIQRLVHFIKEEKPFFESKIKADDLQKIICVKGKHNNNRIISQSGAFFLFGLNAILDENGTNSFGIERVSIRNKSKILEELDLLNINESTVFPYIENSAKFIAQKYENKY